MTTTMHAHSLETGVELRFDADSPFGVAAFDFLRPGDGIIYMNPASPGSISALRLQDPWLAQRMLTDAIGADAYERVRRVAYMGGTRQIVLGSEVLLDGLARVAFTQWYARWTPLAIPRQVCRLDVAEALVVAGYLARAQDLYYSAEHGGQGLAELLVRIAAEVAALPEASSTVLRERAIRQLDAAMTAVGPRHDQYGSLERAKEALEGARAATEDAAAAALREWQEAAATEMRGPAYAEPMRGAGMASSSVDWTRVGEHQLVSLARDGEILRQFEDGVSTVIVPAHPLFRVGQSVGEHGLIAELVNDTGEPVAAAPLLWEPESGESGRFVAEFTGVAAADAALRAEVYSIDQPEVRAGTGVRRDLDAAHREAVRALVRARLAQMGGVDKTVMLGQAREHADMAAAYYGQAEVDSRSAAGLAEGMRHWVEDLDSFSCEGPGEALFCELLYINAIH